MGGLRRICHLLDLADERVALLIGHGVDLRLQGTIRNAVHDVARAVPELLVQGLAPLHGLLALADEIVEHLRALVACGGNGTDACQEDLVRSIECIEFGHGSSLSRTTNTHSFYPKSASNFSPFPEAAPMRAGMEGKPATEMSAECYPAGCTW